MVNHVTEEQRSPAGGIRGQMGTKLREAVLSTTWAPLATRARATASANSGRPTPTALAASTYRSRARNGADSPSTTSIAAGTTFIEWNGPGIWPERHGRRPENGAGIPPK